MTENKHFMLDDAGELIDLNNHSFIDYGEECCNLLNELTEENQALKERRHEDINELAVIAIKYKALEEENKELKDKLFEAEKDYLIETADISDKLYLDEEIRKLKKEVYGDFE